MNPAVRPDNQDMHLARDESGVVLSWLVKVLAIVALLGVVIFDAGSLAVNYFGLDSRADEIAFEAALLFDGPGAPSQRDLEDEVRKLARGSGARTLEVTTTEGKLRIRIRRRARTLIVSRIDFIKKWGIATVEGSAGIQP